MFTVYITDRDFCHCWHKQQPADKAVSVCVQVGSTALPSVAPSASSASSTSGTGFSSAMPTPTASATAARRSRFGGSSSMENLAALDVPAGTTRDKRFSLFNSCKFLGCAIHDLHLLMTGRLRLHKEARVSTCSSLMDPLLFTPAFADIKLGDSASLNPTHQLCVPNTMLLSTA